MNTQPLWQSWFIPRIGDRLAWVQLGNNVCLATTRLTVGDRYLRQVLESERGRVVGCIREDDVVGGSLEGNLTAHKDRVAIVTTHVDMEGTILVERKSTRPPAVRDVFNSRREKKKIIEL